MKMLLYFGRVYPLATFGMLGALLLAAVADGVGMGSVIGLFSMAEDLSNPAGTIESGDGWIQSRVVAFYAFIGVELSIQALLGTIVIAIWVKACLALVAKRQIGYTVARSAMDLRLRLLDALMTTRWSYFVHQPVGAVSNAFATEAGRASTSYLLITTVVALLIQSTLYTGLALALSWKATAGNFVVAFFGLIILRKLIKTTRKAGMKQTRLMNSLLSRVSDTLQALKPLKAMAREERIAPLLEDNMTSLNRVARKQVFATEALGSIQEPLVISCLAVGAWVSMIHLGMDWKTVTGLGLVLARILASLAKAQRQYQKFTNNESALWSMLDTIERAEREREEWHGGEAPVLEREISLNGIDKAYDDLVVLSDTSLSIPAGEITALVGPSGSGKTTITDLILGLVDPDCGEVKIDDLSLAKIDIRAWRQSIGYVPQDMFLINDTIMANVTLGEEGLEREQVELSLRRAGAWEFVSTLPEGLDTKVGERGARLSGGQRQRIAIARALVHEPTLLILDEATTALDPQTEKAVWDAMRQLHGQVTILAISHQPRLAEIADRIYLIEDGRARRK